MFIEIQPLLLNKLWGRLVLTAGLMVR